MRTATAACAAWFALAACAWAHHSFAAEDDGDKFVTIRGVVKKIDWQNPHIHFLSGSHQPERGSGRMEV